MTGVLGPYEIRGELGRGAMAVVWRGYDPSIGREVALKEPKIDDSLDPVTREELVTRFIREGRTAGKLNHPGIVTIYNAEVIDGRPVIAMELIEGETLSSLLHRGRLPVGAAVGIAEQLLDALSYAHARGVVHRDIKPDNVFVTDDGRVKLTDFGIAHAGGGTALTQAGTVMGTPGYMAPEQVRGETVDACADLFSVGVMLFEMLAGENPFMADGAHPTTIMYRVLNEPLPDVRSAMAEATPGLAATIAVATAKDSAQRFGSAEDMRRALLGEVAVAMPKVAKADGGKGRTALIAAVVAAVAVVGLLALAVWPGGQGAGATVSTNETDGEAAIASKAVELNLTADALAALRVEAEDALWAYEVEDWDLSDSARSTCGIDEDSISTHMEVAQLGLSFEDANTQAAARHLMSEGRALNEFNHRLARPVDGPCSESLLKARYHDWAARAYLSGDPIRMTSVETVSNAAATLPDAGMQLWFLARTDQGRAIVDIDSEGYFASWEFGEEWAGLEGWAEYDAGDPGGWESSGSFPEPVAGMTVWRSGLSDMRLEWIEQNDGMHGFYVLRPADVDTLEQYLAVAVPEQ